MLIDLLIKMLIDPLIKILIDLLIEMLIDPLIKILIDLLMKMPFDPLERSSRCEAKCAALDAPE